MRQALSYQPLKARRFQASHLYVAAAFIVLSTPIGGSAGEISKAGRVEIKGFKHLNLGMTPSEVASLGYTCEKPPIVIGASDPVQCKGINTLFGLRADVFVLFRQSRASFISVTAHSTRPVNLIDSFTKAYGHPRAFLSPSFAGNLLKTTYWLSRSGTSVSITSRDDKELDTPEAKSDTAIYSQSATYQNETLTEEMLQREQTSLNPESDF